MFRQCGVFVYLFCFWTSGCSSSWEGGEHWKTEKKIEKLEEYQRKFGEIAVSRPLLAKKTDYFKFDLPMKAEDIYDEIGFQLAGKFGTFDVASFRGAAKFRAPDLTIAPAQASLQQQVGVSMADALLRGYAANPTAQGAAILGDMVQRAMGVVTATTQPSDEDPVTIKAIDAPDLPDNKAAELARKDAELAKVLATSLAAEVELRPRDKMSETTDSFSHKRLQEFNTDPGAWRLPDDRSAFLFVGNISVSPGEATREDFVAEVVLSFDLLKPDGATISDYLTPTAIFPSTIGQNMRLETLSSYERDLAVQLQGEGYVAAANALYERSRINQSNVAAVGQLVSVSSFNRGSSEQIGFRIRGEYVPTDLSDYDPKKGARSAILLQPINLPFVVFAYAKKASSNQNDVKTIRVNVATHWTPVNADAASKVKWKYPELKYQEGEYRAIVLESLRSDEKIASAKANPMGSNTWRDSWWRVAPDSLLYGGLSAYEYSLPFQEDAPKTNAIAPTLKDIYPTQLPADRPSIVVISGDNLGNSQFVIGGGPCERIDKADNKNVAIVRVDPTFLGKPQREQSNVLVKAVGPGGPEVDPKLHVSFSFVPQVAPRTEFTSPTGKRTLQEFDGGVQKNVFSAPPKKE